MTSENRANSSKSLVPFINFYYNKMEINARSMFFELNICCYDVHNFYHVRNVSFIHVSVLGFH